MSSNNNNNKKVQKEENKNNSENCKKNPKRGFRDDFFNFGMDIKDDIFDPFDDDFFGFDSLENRMFRNFRNIFGLLNENEETEKPKEVETPKEVEIPKEVETPKEVEIPKEVETPKEVKVEEEKEEEINTNTKKEEKEEEINTNTKEEEKEEEITTDTKKEEKEEEINTDTKKVEEVKPKEENKENIANNGTFFSKVYTCSYNNINGKEESYTSQTIKQANNGHNISETKETYKNSNGVCKSAYQRGLDDKTARFIKEKNLKTGEHNQKKVMKGIEENEINDFNKSYNDYCRKCGFRKNFHNLCSFDPFGISRKQITDGNSNLFFHRLLF